MNAKIKFTTIEDRIGLALFVLSGYLVGVSFTIANMLF